MPRKKTILAVSLFAAVCLGIGILWTVWIDGPLRAAAKTPAQAKLHIEVWEPGKDMATVSMTVPKRHFDTMIAFGLDPKIVVDHLGEIKMKDLVRQVDALPPGKRLEVDDRGGRMYVWVDLGDSTHLAGGENATRTTR
ncbi:MAG: hypothetical protein ACM3JJ_08320 [Hyphomicrobiales bacterium]